MHYYWTVIIRLSFNVWITTVKCNIYCVNFLYTTYQISSIFFPSFLLSHSIPFLLLFSIYFDLPPSISSRVWLIMGKKREEIRVSLGSTQLWISFRSSIPWPFLLCNPVEATTLYRWQSIFYLVWCGVVWCGVVWCGVVWYAQTLCDIMIYFSIIQTWYHIISFSSILSCLLSYSMLI